MTRIIWPGYHQNSKHPLTLTISFKVCVVHKRHPWVFNLFYWQYAFTNFYRFRSLRAMYMNFGMPILGTQITWRKMFTMEELNTFYCFNAQIWASRCTGLETSIRLSSAWFLNLLVCVMPTIVCDESSSNGSATHITKMLN